MKDDFIPFHDRDQVPEGWVWNDPEHISRAAGRALLDHWVKRQKLGLPPFVFLASQKKDKERAERAERDKRKKRMQAEAVDMDALGGPASHYATPPAKLGLKRGRKGLFGDEEAAGKPPSSTRSKKQRLTNNGDEDGNGAATLQVASLDGQAQKKTQVPPNLPSLSAQ